MMKEPSNSWEVSYVISLGKPHIDLKVTREDLYRKIGRKRSFELRAWMDRYFCHRWFLDHI